MPSDPTAARNVMSENFKLAIIFKTILPQSSIEMKKEIVTISIFLPIYNAHR
jgi:hypothetical protein